VSAHSKDLPGLVDFVPHLSSPHTHKLGAYWVQPSKPSVRESDDASCKAGHRRPRYTIAMSGSTAPRIVEDFLGVIQLLSDGSVVRGYRWPNGPGTMGRHGHGPKKHDTSTARPDSSAVPGPLCRPAVPARARHDLWAGTKKAR
jgi:hypothetical protein